MRILPLRTVAFCTVAASVFLALWGAARPAAAQNSTLPDTALPTVATIRGGIYLPFNSTIKNDVGKTLYGGGIDYTFQQQRGISRTNISLDYIERNSGGADLRIIPLTVSQFALQHGQHGVNPYFGIGVGVYFLHQDLNDTSGSNTDQNTNKTAIGGFLAAGLDLPANLLIEARYHILQPEGGTNADGLQLMAGIRF